MSTYTTTTECDDRDNNFIKIVKKYLKVINWLGIKSVGKEPPNSTRWFHQLKGSSGTVPLRPGYDARQLIQQNKKSYEVSCQRKQQSDFGPLFQCEVLQDNKIIFTSTKTKPKTTTKNFFGFLNL